MTAAEQAAIRQVRQLFDKHDKYVNRNRHDFMFFFNDAVASTGRFDAQASPDSVASAIQDPPHSFC